jgi:serine/threonine protein kinase
MDWGLAKRIASTEVQQAAACDELSQEFSVADDSNRGFQTMDGAVVGTPPYLSPEQAMGSADVGPGADIYVLGMILYSILALRPPVFLTNAAQVIQMISENNLIPLRAMARLAGPDGSPAPELLHCPSNRIPDGLIAIVEKAMAFEVKDRYQAVEELQADINSFQHGYAPKAEQAGFFRQLQLLISRRRREAILLGSFLVLSQVVLAFFFARLATDRKKLRNSQEALAKSNTELRESYEHLEQIFFQLRSAAERNYHDAISLLKSKQPTGALEQINLAIIVAPEGSTQRACYLIVRAHARVTLGFFKEALDDYREASLGIPGLLPMDQIQSDLEQAIEDGGRPKEGWVWEKVVPPVMATSPKLLHKLGQGAK